MHFRHLKASDLETATELPPLQGWLEQVRPEDATLLLVAPAGSGKAAAVGCIARGRNQPVVLSDLLELLELPDTERQLRNLLLLCESQRDAVLYLDRLDSLLRAWDQRHPEAAGRPAEVFRRWLESGKERLRANHALLVVSGRNVEQLPPALCAAFDRVLVSPAENKKKPQTS